MTIYKITNIFNYKCYIGQTKRKINDRFTRHINDAQSGRLDTHLARAIRKWGRHSFKIEVLEDGINTQEELNQREVYWILVLDTINREKGYNETASCLKCGGNTYLSKTKEEMDTIRQKIKESKMGGLNPNSTKIRMENIKTHEIKDFNSMAECCREMGFPNHTLIHRRCSGKIKKPYLDIYNFSYI